MTATPTTETTDLRCSTLTAQLGERPAGSAGGADRYVLVELPLPWPRKIDAHPLLADVDRSVVPADLSVSLLGIRSTDIVGSPDDGHRIIIYERRRPFDGFDRAELTVPREGLTAAVGAAITNGSAAHPGGVVDDDHQDLLLCTHGSRDRCCGQLGTLLHLELDGTLPSSVRIWRTSHTGGHRFAPTGILFPSGTAWAGLDAGLTRAIVEQRVDTTELLPHFRGNVGIGGRPQQVAEGLAFLESGWAWLHTRRTAELVASQGGEHVVQVSSDLGDLEVTMVEETPAPVPICGEGVEVAVKSSPQFLITDHH